MSTKSPSKLFINIVGIGKVSSSIARQLKGKTKFGHILSRDRAKAEQLAKELDGIPVTYDDDFLLDGIVLFGVNDSVLPYIQQKLERKVNNIIAVHFSGFHSSAIFPEEWSPVSMHPNCSVADEYYSFKDVLFGIEGSEKGLEIAKKIVKLVGGKYVTISTHDKALYHLAAVISSNFPMALAYLSLKIYEDIGIDNENARKIISTLMESVSKNISKYDLKDALTGPVKRKDWKVVEEEGKVFKEFFKEKHGINEDLYQQFIKILQKIVL